MPFTKPALASCVVLLLALLSKAHGNVPAPVGVTAPAEQLVDLMVKGDFAGAEKLYDAAMKAALPAAKLQDTWKALTQQVGDFQKRLRTRTTDQDGYKVVLVTCQFEKAPLDIRVVLDAKGQVAGLSFRPATPDPSAFKTPTYAKPASYTEKDVTVGEGGWKLPATLTLPANAKNAPAVVLVQGSGPSDRDETEGLNKPFRDLAWGLASRGIAVLRYDKRTFKYAAKLAAPGGLKGFTAKEEAIDDTLAAAALLRKTDGIDPKRIFILGHSLGATLAPRIGQADPALAGLILLAGTPRPLEEVAAEQLRYLASLQGKLTPQEQEYLDSILAELAKIKKLTPADADKTDLLFYAPPSYWLDLHAHDPVAIAKTLSQPMLILQGGRDYQVTQTDFDLWKQALSTNPRATLKLYPDLNHLFIPGQGKSQPAEYETAGNVAEPVITDIADWIMKTP